MHLGVPPFMDIIGMFDWDDDSDFDWTRIPLWLRLTIIAAHKAKLAHGQALNGPCVSLDQKKKRCRQYEHRPSICASFEPGNQICIEDRQLLGIE